MNTIKIIVKVTDGCNLRCKYCHNSGTQYNTDVLPLEKFERLLVLCAESRDAIDLIWHGGEPLTVGKQYMQKAVEIEEKVFKTYSVEIRNFIQTNATLIDAWWVKFFKKYRFRVGISFDGADNGKYRQGTDKVLAAIKLMQKNGLNFGCLAVVPDEEYDLIESYKFFKENKLAVRFSPVFAEGGGGNMQGVTAANYVAGMNALFDYWFTDKDGVEIKDFRSYVSLALGGDERACTNGSCLGKWLGITSSGDVFNCGRDSMKNYPYGNICDVQSIDELYRSQGFTDLLKGSIQRRNKCKQSCDLFEFCQGGCPDMAIIENGLNEIPSFSCECFRGIFTHVRDAVEKIKAEGTPLSSLNPVIRKIAIACLGSGAGAQ